MSKVEAIQYGDRKVYAVAAFNRGVAEWLQRLPTVWVEGEVTELRRNPRWQSVFFTLKDPADGACLGVTIGRARFDALRLDLADGERVHVFGRPELFAAKGDFRMRALSIERFGLGDHLAALERLKKKLAAEGVFERKRPLPFLPRRVGVITGNDAAAKQDILSTITARFPAASVVVAETYVQGPFAATAMMEALREVAAAPEVDVIVLARGGGSFEDLLPFSDERLVRAVAACAVPVVSAVGHEQDTPLCDLAADARASTPTAAARLVVPDASELHARLTSSRRSASRTARACTRATAARACAGSRTQAGAVGARRRPTTRAVPARDPRTRLCDRAHARRDRSLEGGCVERRCGGSRSRRRNVRSTRRVSAEPTFEDAQRELEQIVERLERGEAGLDEAIKLWERGEELYKVCVGKLDAAHGRIEELARRAESAKP
jgi:exodeoxyribonuclease VII large subunit